MTLNAPEQQLRDEISGLSVDELLGLCYYSMQSNPERLRLYLDVMRTQHGRRAQFAACLICFDMARHGDATSQREFVYLADTMKDLAEATDVVESLVAHDDYLTFIWDLCREQLYEVDPRIAPGEGDISIEEEVIDAIEIDLLSDDDIDDFEIDIDDEGLRERFDSAVDAFLGRMPGRPVYFHESGFHMRSRHDTERIETFIRELESLQGRIPDAAGFLPLVLLFYGTRMRSKNIFGGINQRKQTLLRSGLNAYMENARYVWSVAGVLEQDHASPSTWPKIADVLLDYLRWRSQSTEHRDVEDYDAVGRLVERDAARRGLR